MSYTNTFITIAPDCPATAGIVPAAGRNGKTKALIEYELLTEHPYTYTGDDLVFEVHIRHKGITAETLAEKGAQIREALLRKPHPCMRASMLPKKFGWGVHYNEEGKIAIYGAETAEYRLLAGRDDIKRLAAMRNSKK